GRSKLASGHAPDIPRPGLSELAAPEDGRAPLKRVRTGKGKIPQQINSQVLGMNKMVAAIIGDDAIAVRKLLEADPGLASCTFRSPKLYRSGIFHWIYAGDTLLHLAAAGYRVEIVRLLLGSGANPNAAENHRKSSPLHYASDGFITGPVWNSKRQIKTIRCLLEKGADIHLQDMNGATALHRAVRTRCAAAVKFLLETGGDPTMRNKPGSTPFHLAVQNTGRGGSGEPAAISAQREIIKTFLTFGVDTRLKDGKGKTVADCARSGWIREM